MNEISKYNKVLLLLTSFLGGYEIVLGVDGYPPHIVILLTISFGILLLTCLLLIFLGFGILEEPVVAVIASILPLGMSSAIVALKFPNLFTPYLIISLAGFITIIISRFFKSHLAAVLSLAIVHSIAGLTIFFSPIYLFQNGLVTPSFLLVSLGGAFIGMGGIFLFLLKSKSSILPNKKIYNLFPTLLFFMTISFLAGFMNGM